MEKTTQQSGNGANIGGTFEVVQKESKPHFNTKKCINTTVSRPVPNVSLKHPGY